MEPDMVMSSGMSLSLRLRSFPVPVKVMLDRVALESWLMRLDPEIILNWDWRVCSCWVSFFSSDWIRAESWVMREPVSDDSVGGDGFVVC